MGRQAGIGKIGTLKKLNNAALAEIDKNSDQIAKGLAEAAKAGNVMSARLLLQLAAATGSKKRVRKGRSLAIDLAKEPSWKDPALKADDVENTTNH